MMGPRHGSCVIVARAMIVRRDHFDEEPTTGDRKDIRLNLLLSSGGWRSSDAVQQLPDLLAPLGVRSHIAESGDEAADLIRQMPIHIAMVDLEIPLSRNSSAEAAGPRVLQMLRRLEPTPPTVVIRPPQPTVRESQRTLCSALREGAFAVIDRPLQIESMLEVMRRILKRYYRNAWPD